MTAPAPGNGTGSQLGDAVEALTGGLEPLAVSVVDLLNSFAIVFVGAFVVTLLATPLVRRLALAGNVTDQPDDPRKAHSSPVPYLGGVAVFLGLITAVAISYVYADGVAALYRQIPFAVVLGMVAIMFTGLADDLWGWHPRLKVAGQLVAAAALAIQDIGVRVAAGVLKPVAVWLDPVLGSENLVFVIPLPGGGELPVDAIYWAGTAIIAVFVIGGCNAANLVDGLDGLLSGVTAIIVVGLLCISLLMALQAPPAGDVGQDSLAGARIVLCLALLGAVLGFLPHNFNPATIFLGDCGSHLIGYLCVVIILMFGEFGQTHLVFAGLIVFSLPIMDTMLAIIRRWLAGTPMSAADDQHVHHQLKRGLGGVKKAVFAMYGFSLAFAILGVTLAALVMLTEMRVRIVYVIALVLFGFFGVIAVKAARRQVRREPATQGSPATLPPPAGKASVSAAVLKKEVTE